MTWMRSSRGYRSSRLISVGLNETDESEGSMEDGGGKRNRRRDAFCSFRLSMPLGRSSETTCLWFIIIS